jgi:glycosyltransferase involved in cell wall biosynthesis
MAAARPVVASALPGLAELVQDGRTGFLVPPGQKVDFSRKTKLLLDHPQLAQELGLAGQRFVTTHHDSRNLARRFDALYRRLAA